MGVRFSIWIVIMAWDTPSFRLFVSHQSANRDQAHDLKLWFKEGYGIDAFVAHDDIKPTLLWQDVIEEHLAEMDGLLAVLTPGFHESDWTDQEVGFGLGRGVLVSWNECEPLRGVCSRRERRHRCN
jgi:hypothetical protein